MGIEWLTYILTSIVAIQIYTDESQENMDDVLEIVSMGLYNR